MVSPNDVLSARARTAQSTRAARPVGERAAVLDRFAGEVLADRVGVGRGRVGLVEGDVTDPQLAVGDSQTGETQKFDGPYSLLKLILRQWPVAFVPDSPRQRHG